MRLLVSVIFVCYVTCTAVWAAEKDQWENPKAWTPATTIEGKEVTLRMYRRTEVDVSEIKSAQALTPEDGCAASYYYHRDGLEVFHGPSYSWKPGGKIEQRSFNQDGRLQYLYRYYPSGEVINSIVFDKKVNQLITSWYEKNGKIAGQYITINKPSCEMTLDDNMYFWGGKKISAEEYSQRIMSYMIQSIE